MAGILSGGKRALFFTRSGINSIGGYSEVKADSNWDPGKTGPKRRKNKDHKPRLEARKAKGHYGSGGGA